MAQKSRNSRRRGRQANWPHHIPLHGWRDIILRAFGRIKSHNIGLIAAGIAFYFFLALFPGLAVIISLYGLLGDPWTVAIQIQRLEGILPQQVIDITVSQAEILAASTSTALGIGLLVSLFLTFFGSTRAVRALIKGLNIAYHEDEKRPFLQQNLTVLALTLFAIIMALTFIIIVALLPALLNILSPMFDNALTTYILWLRWPFLFLLGIFLLEVMYRYGPSRTRARWRWLSLGSVLAASAWVIISSLFSWYVSNFGNYTDIYGTLGAVVVLLMWLWLSAIAMLLGAEINAAIEHQTGRDTTTGKSKPMGKRGAYVADTIGEVS